MTTFGCVTHREYPLRTLVFAKSKVPKKGRNFMNVFMYEQLVEIRLLDVRFYEVSDTEKLTVVLRVFSSSDLGRPTPTTWTQTHK